MRAGGNPRSSRMSVIPSRGGIGMAKVPVLEKKGNVVKVGVLLSVGERTRGTIQVST